MPFWWFHCSPSLIREECKPQPWLGSLLTWAAKISCLTLCQGTAFGKGKKLDQRSATSCSMVKQLEDPGLGLSFSTSPSSWVKWRWMNQMSQHSLRKRSYSDNSLCCEYNEKMMIKTYNIVFTSKQCFSNRSLWLHDLVQREPVVVSVYQATALYSCHCWLWYPAETFRKLL